MSGFKDCPVNISLGIDDPNNVFSCKIEQDCCTKNLEPACCGQQDTMAALQMQLQLWGSLALILLLMAAFIWWCRTDETCCDVEKPCLYRFGCKKYPQDDDEKEPGDQSSSTSFDDGSTLVHDADGGNPAELEEAAHNLDAIQEEDLQIKDDRSSITEEADDISANEGGEGHRQSQPQDS